MGLLNDDYYDNLLKQSVPKPEQQQAPKPTVSQTIERGVVNLEDKGLIEPLGNFEQRRIQGFSKENPKFAGLLSKEQQIKKFGGEVGSIEYLNYISRNPIESYFFRGIGEGLGITFPEKEVWDTFDPAKKALYTTGASGFALAKIAIKLPRELVKIVPRVGLSAYQAVKPTSWQKYAQTGKFESFAEEEAKYVPWLGEVPTFFKHHEEATSAGYGKLAATLQTVGLVAGDLSIVGSLAPGIKSAFTPKKALNDARGGTITKIGRIEDIPDPVVINGKKFISEEEFYFNDLKGLVNKYGKQDKYKQYKGDDRLWARVADDHFSELDSATQRFLEFEAPAIDFESPTKPTYKGFANADEFSSGVENVHGGQITALRDTLDFQRQELLSKGGGIGEIETVAKAKQAEFNQQIAQKNPGVSEYYPIQKSVAKEYGGSSKDTFLKVSPGKIDGSTVEVSVIRKVPKGKNPLNKTETKIVSQEFKVKDPVFDLDAPLTERILPRPLKGFEDAPITEVQAAHLGQITKLKGVDSAAADFIMRGLTGKKAVGELTQGQYVKMSHILASYGDNISTLGNRLFVKPAEVLSPQGRYFRSVEERHGIPVYSEGYVKIEDAFRAKKILDDADMALGREIHGKYAGSRFGEERRLIRAYAEGDKAAILKNNVLDQATKKELVQIAEKLAAELEKKRLAYGIEGKIENYQSHIQDLGGIYQLYKGEQFPGSVEFFAEQTRKGSIGPQIDDSLALWDIYTHAGNRKMTLEDVLPEVKGLHDALPETLNKPLRSYVEEKLGYAGRTEKFLNEFGIKLNESKAASKLGIRLPADVARRGRNLLMDTSYASIFGGVPIGKMVRNLAQDTLTYARFGNKFYVKARAHIAKNPKAAFDELRSKGFTVELGQPFGEELVREAGALGKGATLYRKATQNLQRPYASTDTFTRAQAYFQAKFIWDDAVARFNSGKLTWEQAEQAIDMRGLSPVDQNIIRQRIISGNQEGAFEHFARLAIDETNFPYRRGTEARAFFGGGKLAGRFTSYPIEYAHTLGSWVKTGQWDKLMRWYASSTLFVRTGKDTFGVDFTKDLFLNPLDVTFSPEVKAVNEAVQWMRSVMEKNAEEMEKHKEELFGQALPLLVPLGVQGEATNDFKRSIQLSAKPDSGIPKGQYGVYSRDGQLLRVTDFKDIWLNLWGFNTIGESETFQLYKDQRSAQFQYSQKKREVLELYQKEEYDKANKIINEFGIKIGPSDFDKYFIPLNQRTFQQLPASQKAQFAPRVFPQ